MKKTKKSIRKTNRIPQPHPLIVWASVFADFIALYHYLSPIAVEVWKWTRTPDGTASLLILILAAILFENRR